MNWDHLRYFAAVARTGSLSAAARDLSVNPATAGRHVDALEQQLGVRLFVRRRDGYLPTGAGERLLRHAERLEAEIFSLGRSLAAESGDIAGTVTITATEALVEPFLIRALPRLRTVHPGLSVDLVRDDRSLNLSRREADIAIRLARPDQRDLRIRPIGRLGFGLYAAPDYLAARGTPDSAEALREHDIIDWLEGQAHLSPAAWLGRVRGKRPAFMRTNSVGGRLAAASAGLGIAMATCVMAERYPTLRRILPSLALPTMDLWLLVHQDLSSLARVRAVLDFVAETATAEAARLLGQQPEAQASTVTAG